MSRCLQWAVRIVIAGVWIFHGLYSKILDGVPRHRLIVGRILGDSFARPLTVLIGTGEILLGLWVLSGRRSRACAMLHPAVKRILAAIIKAASIPCMPLSNTTLVVLAGTFTNPPQRLATLKLLALVEFLHHDFRIDLKFQIHADPFH